jgi:hypothetical protein
MQGASEVGAWPRSAHQPPGWAGLRQAFKMADATQRNATLHYGDRPRRSDRCLCVRGCRSRCKAHTRLRVQRASSVPPRPLWAEDKCKPRALGAARSRSCIWILRHCDPSGAHSRDPVARNDGGDDTPYPRPSSPAKAGDPVLRGVSDGIEKPRRTGYPACAGYDNRVWNAL